MFMSHYATEVCKCPCMDLEDRGLMTPAGRRAFEIIYKQNKLK